MNQFLTEKRNLIYLFDLPKKEFTSTRLATYLQENGIPLKDSLKLEEILLNFSTKQSCTSKTRLCTRKQSTH
jgi:hypothetical protein